MLRWLRQQWRANSLYFRRDYEKAAGIFEQIAADDPSDGFAAYMLSTCHERLDRASEALRWAERAVAGMPDSLTALQRAARLAIVTSDYEKAAGYLARALALPEIVTEMPNEKWFPKPVRWLVWLLHHTPVLRRRLRPGVLEEVQPGYQALELQKWKQWAQGYLAWIEGHDPTPPVSNIH